MERSDHRVPPADRDMCKLHRVVRGRAMPQVCMQVAPRCPWTGCPQTCHSTP